MFVLPLKNAHDVFVRIDCAKSIRVTFKRYDGGAGPFEKHSPGSADGGHVGLWAAMDSVQLTYCCMRSCHLFEMRRYYAEHELEVVVFVVHIVGW